MVSNATRWNTFEKLLSPVEIPANEKRWQQRYQKSPSFFSLHMGVKAELLSPETECHHILLSEWEKMMDSEGTIFVSIPTLLDPELAPKGYHIIHAFATHSIDEWQGLSEKEYEAKKEATACRIVDKLEKIFPGIDANLDYLEAGTPKTHRRFLGRVDGTYGPIPRRKLRGIVGNAI